MHRAMLPRAGVLYSYITRAKPLKSYHAQGSVTLGSIHVSLKPSLSSHTMHKAVLPWGVQSQPLKSYHAQGSVTLGSPIPASQVIPCTRQCYLEESYILISLKPSLSSHTMHKAVLPWGVLYSYITKAQPLKSYHTL